MINAKYKGPLITISFIIAVVVGYGLLTMRDQRSTTEEIGNAVKDTGDKVSDKIKDNTNP